MLATLPATGHVPPLITVSTSLREVNVNGKRKVRVQVRLASPWSSWQISKPDSDVLYITTHCLLGRQHAMKFMQ